MIQQYNYQFSNDIEWLGIIPIGKTVSFLDTINDNIHIENHSKFIGMKLPCTKVYNFNVMDIQSIEKTDTLTPSAIIAMIILFVVIPGAGIAGSILSYFLCRTECYKINLKNGIKVTLFAQGPVAEQFIKEINPTLSMNSNYYSSQNSDGIYHNI